MPRTRSRCCIADAAVAPGFTYSWSTEQKVRPGLNVFDDKGNELEWDYEHDTR